MTRRPLGVGMLVLTVLLAAPARLFGDAAPKSSTSTTTTTTAGTTTPGPSPTPGPTPAAGEARLFPRRPGARYDDVEAGAHGTLSIGFSRLKIVRRAIVPPSVRPPGLVPAGLGAYRRAALVDGYAPSTNRTTGDLLHVVIHVTPGISPSDVICVATFARDGIARVPYAMSTRSPSTASTTSMSEPESPNPIDIGLFFPIGADRGRVYITCAPNDGSPPDGIGLFGVGGRPVWGLDV